MNFQINYIAHGKLYNLVSGSEESEVSSTFVSEMKKRLLSIENRGSAFKGQGSSFMQGGIPEMSATSVEDSFDAEFSCIAAGLAPGMVYYAIDAGEVRGLFNYDLKEKHEQRLYHGPQYRFTAIAPRRTDDEVEWLLAAAQDHGVSRIALFTPDKGGGIREVTEGDCLDCFPVWKPGEGREIVYQSAGIARNANDNSWMGLGPASIEGIDLDAGEMKTVLDDPAYDFLCPAYDNDGSLYFLRRPFEPVMRPSIWKSLLDIVLFPFRMLRAILAFLNIFSVFFSGKPLQTAGQGPKRNGPDPKAVFLHGRWVNMEKQMRDAEIDDMKAIVPQNWELMKLSLEGTTSVIRKGVMAFALAANGTVLYSNGRGIFMLSLGGKPKKISSRSLVSSISIVRRAR